MLHDKANNIPKRSLSDTDKRNGRRVKENRSRYKPPSSGESGCLFSLSPFAAKIDRVERYRRQADLALQLALCLPFSNSLQTCNG